MKLTIRLAEGAKAPTLGSATSAGYDLYSYEDVEYTEDVTKIIRTGVFVSHIPEGYYISIRDRSSMAIRGFVVGGGVVDNDYRGEIKVILHSINTETIKKGDKIAQFILQPYATAEVVIGEKVITERDEKGFGSTGA